MFKLNRRSKTKNRLLSVSFMKSNAKNLRHKIINKIFLIKVTLIVENSKYKLQFNHSSLEDKIIFNNITVMITKLSYAEEITVRLNYIFS